MARQPRYSLELTLDDTPAAAHVAPPTAAEFIAGERAIPEPQGVQIHPAARLLPMMAAAQFEGLRKSIRAHGFDREEPLVFLRVEDEEQLLDGRNRLAAALAEGLALQDLPRKDFLGDDPVAYVLRRNKDRRQLTPSQLAAVARDAEPLLAEEARRRMAAGGRRGKGGVEPSPPSPRNESGRAAVQAAQAVGAGVGATKTMISVGKRAPELVELVKDGALKVAEAARLAQLKDPEERAGKVAAIRGGADPAEVVPPPAPRPEPNLGKMLGLLFVRCGEGSKLGPWRDLLAKVVLQIGAKEAHVLHGGKRLSLVQAVELLAERLPRPKAP